MADYVQQTWVDDDGTSTTGTLLTAARLNNLEAGVKDAAQNSKQRGAIGSRPAAAAGNKNWIWVDDTTGQVSYSTGSAWVNIGAPNTEAQWAPSRASQQDFSLANNNGSAAIPLSGAGNGWLAQPFTPGATGGTHGFDVFLGRDAGVTAGLIYVELWSDSSGSPNARIASAAFPFNYVALSSGAVGSISMGDLGVTLNAGTTYWLVVRVTGVTGGNINYGRTSTTTFSTVKTSTDGSTWGAVANRFAFAHFKLTDGPVAATAPDPGIKSGALSGSSTRGSGVSGTGMYGVYGSSVKGVGLGGDSTDGPGVLASSDSYAAVVGRRQSSGSAADLLRLENELAAPLTRVDSAGKLALIAGLTSSGPIVTCTSSTRPGSPWTGLVIFETDTERLLEWNGTSWRLVAPQTDTLQAGVIASGDGAVTSLAVSAAGAVTFTAAAGTGWVSTSGILLRTAFASGAQAPALDGGSSLPASGHTRGYGLEIDTQGVWHLVQLGADVTGTATANGTTAVTNADGIAATSGRLRIWTFAISNISGTFSLNAATQHDRRSWARGAFRRIVRANTGNIAINTGTSTAIDAANQAIRLECMGNPIRFVWMARVFAGTQFNQITPEIRIDGAAMTSADMLPDTGGRAISLGGASNFDYAFFTVTATPAAGTHLFQPFAKSAGTGGISVTSDANNAIQFIAEEILRQDASNGTS